MPSPDHDSLTAHISPSSLAQALGYPYRRNGRDYRTTCPACNHARPKLTIYGTSHGPRAKCHVCGFFASPVNLIRKRFPAMSTADALAHLAVPHDYNPAPLPPPPPPVYPDLSELPTIPVTDHDRAYLASRGLVPFRCRSLHPTAPLPLWAQHFRPHHTLLLPAYGPDSDRPLSVRAWATRPTDKPKRLPPKGYATVGLTLRSHPDPHAQHPVTVLTEGEPDLLATHPHTPHPIISVISGSTLPASLRTPGPPRHLLILTHPDQAGDRYAELHTRSLHPSVTAHRRRPPADLDELDHATLSRLLTSP